jgi:hypothetical protein
MAFDGLVAEDQPGGVPRRELHEGVRALAQLLSRFQEAGELRADFDPQAVAIAIRAAIDAAPARLSADPQFDIDGYTWNLIQMFDLATRASGQT